MNFLTCHIFGIFALYFEFAAFSRLAFPAPNWRKAFESAAERSSLKWRGEKKRYDRIERKILNKKMQKSEILGKARKNIYFF
jgi:hypothetical protein